MTEVEALAKEAVMQAGRARGRGDLELEKHCMLACNTLLAQQAEIARLEARIEAEDGTIHGPAIRRI